MGVLLWEVNASLLGFFQKVWSSICFANYNMPLPSRVSTTKWLRQQMRTRKKHFLIFYFFSRGEVKANILFDKFNKEMYIFVQARISCPKSLRLRDGSNWIEHLLKFHDHGLSYHRGTP